MLSPSKRQKCRPARAAANVCRPGAGKGGTRSPRAHTAEIKFGWQAQRSPSGTPQFSLPELCTTNAAHKGNEAPEGNELALPGSFQHRVLQQWETESDPESVLLRGRSLFDNTVRFQNKHQENKAR